MGYNPPPGGIYPPKPNIMALSARSVEDYFDPTAYIWDERGFMCQAVCEIPSTLKWEWARMEALDARIRAVFREFHQEPSVRQHPSLTGTFRLQTQMQMQTFASASEEGNL